ncbi:hypothetical protein H0Z60_18435 [Ectothiorhodospiraceae bacterium WFHF3C12]|nr:hypothetical protein [Ectothiorhodospiraceae bacterium WFHF3C12]
MAASSRLAIPPQAKPGADSFDIRPRSVEEWLRQLPVANLGETSRRLYNALREVNRLEAPAAKRLSFLEQIRPTHGYVLEGLRKHYLNRDFPLPEKNRRVAQLVMALTNELAVGYQIVLEQRGNGMRGLSRRQQGLAFHRTAKTLGALLIEGYLIYEPSPQGVWRRLHTLFRMARAEGFDRFACRDELLAPESEQTTVAEAYLQTLLTAATGPFRMNQGEAARIDKLMEQLAPAAELFPSDDERARQAIFRVDPDSDHGPVPVFRGDNGAEPSQLALMTDRVLDALEHGRSPRVRGLLRRGAPLEAEPALQERVTLALGDAPRRQHARLPATSPVQVVLGLGHIHRMLVEQLGLDLDGEKGLDPHFTSREIKAADGNGSDVWDLIYRPAPELTPKDQINPTFTTEPRPKAQSTNGEWRLVNVSAGGYCLFSDPKQTARAHVGELVALREVNAREMPWQTAVIRWMKHTPKSGMHLGVQVIAPRPKPVVVQRRGENAARHPDRGLLLPEIRPTGQPATLVTPPLHYSVEQEAQITTRGTAQEVVLIRELDHTRSFSQFVFRTTGHPGEGDDRFESVFASI